jgi:hypothetical protein
MDRSSLNEVLSDIHKRLGITSIMNKDRNNPAANYQEPKRQFFRFIELVMNEVHDRCLDFKQKPEEAFRFIEEVATAMEAKGLLPPFPTASSSPSEVGRWLAAAQNSELTKNAVREAMMRSFG